MNRLFARLTPAGLLLSLVVSLSSCTDQTIEDEGEVRDQMEQSIERIEASADKAQAAADRSEYFLEHGEMPPEAEGEEDQ